MQPLSLSIGIPKVSARSGRIDNTSPVRTGTANFGDEKLYRNCNLTCESPMVLTIYNFHLILHDISGRPTILKKCCDLGFIIKPKFSPLNCNNFQDI